MNAVQLLHCVLMLWICLHKTAFGADEVCGQSIDDSPLPVLTSGLGKINSSQSAWPWMAAIRQRDPSDNNTYEFSGFLIDRRHVLSDASSYIFGSVDEYRVRFGNVNQKEADEYRVIGIAIHPGYEYKDYLFYDNIAVLTLDREVDFPGYNPVCLPDDKVRRMVLDNMDATKAWWGTYRPKGGMSVSLKNVSALTIISDQECQQTLQQALRSNFKRQFPKGIDRSFLCAGSKDGKDVCKGDAGGPLMIRYRNRWFAVGITSFGLNTCTVPGSPSGYTNISNYVDWIKENTPDTDKVCGQSNAIPPIPSGVKATEGAWPWMVAIQLQEKGQLLSLSYSHYCSGFLIDRRHVLSAAHCYSGSYQNAGMYRALIGSIDRVEADEYNITRFVVHEFYTPGMFYDDIAILTLDREVQFENYIPVSLPDEEVEAMELAGTRAAVAGWSRNVNVTHLQQLGQVLIIDNQECQKILSDIQEITFPRQFPIGINKGTMCAGLTDGGKHNLCEVSSGAPLMIWKKNQWYAVGLLSFGLCKRNTVPGGFIRISSYLDWIRENINDRKPGKPSCQSTFIGEDRYKP